MKKTGVLLINLGTPDSPGTADVRRYLREFLNDPRVIDISAFRRFMLVNGIIVQGTKVSKALQTTLGNVGWRISSVDVWKKTQEPEPGEIQK